MKRRVVITGCGVISPIGSSLQAVWDSLVARRSGVGLIQSFPSESLPAKAGAEVRDFTGHIDNFGPLSAELKKTIRKGLKVMCREIQLGVAATQLALVDASLDPSAFAPERIGVTFGSDYIMTLPEEFAAGVKACLNEAGRFEWPRWAEQGMPQVTPLWLLKYLPNMPACHVAIYNDLRGPNNSLTVREASSNLALAEAYSTIARGSAEVVLTGATGGRVHPLRTIHTAMQEELAQGDGDPVSFSRPFDRRRHGMVVGEGAATLVLEELEFARARGAKILGELVGQGASAVLAPNAVARRERSMENAMRAALRAAELSPDQVGHVHAHGLSTRHSDVEEAQAIAGVFGSRPVPVVAAKSYFGNLGAAGGMVELLTSLLALEHGHLFPTLNYEEPDPECPLAVVVDANVPSGDSVLSVNVTPQGQASAVVVRRFAA